VSGGGLGGGDDGGERVDVVAAAARDVVAEPEDLGRLADGPAVDEALGGDGAEGGRPVGAVADDIKEVGRHDPLHQLVNTGADGAVGLAQELGGFEHAAAVGVNGE